MLKFFFIYDCTHDEISTYAVFFCINVLFTMTSCISTPEPVDESHGAVILSDIYIGLLEKIGDGEYEAALEGLKELVDTYPDFYKGYEKIAAVYESLGKLDEGLAYFDTLEPTSYTLWAHGLIYTKRGEYFKSSDKYKKAIEIGPHFFQVFIAFIDDSLAASENKESVLQEIKDYLRFSWKAIRKIYISISDQDI